MVIDIFQDTVCPWCRIGKQNLQTALAEWQGEEVEIRYRAFQLDPTTPLEGHPYQETMLKKMGGTPEQLHSALQRVTDAGQAAGVRFDFSSVQTMPNTILSHQTIALTPEERKQDMVDAIYRAYFEDGKDIGDREVLLRLAEQIGLNREDISARLLAKEGLEEVEEDLEFAGKAGITGVPFFIINNKYALTGAQPAGTFLQALEKIQSEK